MVSKQILLIKSLNKPELNFITQSNNQAVLFQKIQLSIFTKLGGFKYSYLSLTIQLNISHLFTHS